MSESQQPNTAQIHNLQQLIDSGWTSRSVKQEIAANLTAKLAAGAELYPGIVGYEHTVLPELNIALLSGHDLLFLGEKGQAKTRLMRSLIQFLDPVVPYLDLPDAPFHEDPLQPLSQAARRFLAEHSPAETPIAWWPREQRYGERLAPGSKFADLIGEIDPAKLVGGVSMGVEESLHFGMIPRMHRGLFAINELPELDELIQVGLFNLLEERDIQIRGLPLRYDLDVMVLFSANPTTYNRSGKVIPQLKDRIGSLIKTHYPKERDLGIQILQQEANLDLGGDYPLLVPRFMQEICEEITVQARKSKYVDHASGVSARLSISNYRTLLSSARHRSILLQERPAVPRISDLGHLPTSSLGKVELDMMSGNQMTETQVLESIIAAAIEAVFRQYVTKHGLDALVEGFAKGIKIEVGDMVPAEQYRTRLGDLPDIWEKAFEVSVSQHPGVQAACAEFVLAGLYAMEKISRSTHHGGSTYQL